MLNTTKFCGLKVFALIGVIALSLLLFSCEKVIKQDNLQTGILKNLTGLDGCGWIIQLSDNTKIEPVNLADFEIELTENLKVILKYHERTDLGSYCMVGKVVELDYLAKSKE
ncbi:MAG: hypothetical protein NTY07_21920 [Bacteroidia bacterium]|nr:hypothetical protein [Bacteroidia bacterium]